MHKPVKEIRSQGVKKISGWDLLINEAKDRIEELRRAVEHFERKKAKGEPYFGKQGTFTQPQERRSA